MAGNFGGLLSFKTCRMCMLIGTCESLLTCVACYIEHAHACKHKQLHAHACKHKQLLSIDQYCLNSLNSLLEAVLGDIVSYKSIWTLT